MINKSGAVCLCPVAAFSNLKGLIFHYLDLNESAGMLDWRDGAIPDSEVWVKLGGDHGGQSFKFCFQIVNVSHPNALQNTILFLPLVRVTVNFNVGLLVSPNLWWLHGIANSWSLCTLDPTTSKYEASTS